MFWKKAFYASAAILMLALAYHLGARSASAQAGSQVVGFTIEPICADYGRVYVMTSSGDVFERDMGSSSCQATSALQPMGNVWSGSGPTPAKPETWGSVKARYR